MTSFTDPSDQRELAEIPARRRPTVIRNGVKLGVPSFGLSSHCRSDHSSKQLVQCGQAGHGQKMPNGKHGKDNYRPV